MERVMGIEPTLSAWKAEVLPLNYTRAYLQPGLFHQHPWHCRAQAVLIEPEHFDCPDTTLIDWWRGEDSNLRRLSQQIYSLPPLTTREPLHRNKWRSFVTAAVSVNRQYQIHTTPERSASIPGCNLFGESLISFVTIRYFSAASIESIATESHSSKFLIRECRLFIFEKLPPGLLEALGAAFEK